MSALVALLAGCLHSTYPLNLTDHQRSIALTTGQKVAISLDRPADPQQRWILLEPPISHIVRQTKSGEGPLRELPKAQLWTFEATGPGAQRLRFELRRVGEMKVEAERSFTVLLEVNH